MGLFVRRDNIGSHMPLYRTGSERTLLVIGLGNIGKDYSGTRHNIGFDAVDAYRKTHDFTAWSKKKELHCELSSGIIGSSRVLLAKPTTLMNDSGRAAQALKNFYKLSNTDIAVIHDELDVEFLTIRCRSGGGSAGHNGIKSITQAIGEDYGRIRVGIGPKKPEQIDSADFVLSSFSKKELEKKESIIKEVCNILDELTASHTLPTDTRKII